MINLWNLSRTGTIKSISQCFEYEIKTDCLSDEKSTFTPITKMDVTEEDFLLAKYPSGKLAFLGVVNSLDNSEVGEKLVCGGLLSLVDFDFPATYMNSSSYELHVNNLLNRYLVNDTNKNASLISLSYSGNTKNQYRPDEKVKATNLKNYLVNGFKKYRVNWNIIGFENNKIKTMISKETKTIKLKNNIHDFIDWEVSTAQSGDGLPNHLLIVSNKTTSSESPVVLYQAFMETNGTITTSINNNVSKPVKTVVNVYDVDAEDKPTYLEVASEELSTSEYNHEINFRMKRDNNILNIEDLSLGMLTDIYYNDKLFKSILTGYTIASSSDYIDLRFGNVRTSGKDIL